MFCDRGIPYPNYTEECAEALSYLPTNRKKISMGLVRPGPNMEFYKLPRVEPDGEYSSFHLCSIVLKPSHLETTRLITSQFPPMTFLQGHVRLIGIKAYGPLIVDLAPGSETTREKWWNIWTAGVAVYTMCIQKGTMGTAINLGGSSGP